MQTISIHPRITRDKPSHIFFPGAALNRVSANQSQLIFSNSLGDGISGNGNIRSPLFADPNSLDFSLAAGSPRLGTGESNSDMGANMSAIPSWMSDFVNGYDANLDTGKWMSRRYIIDNTIRKSVYRCDI